MSITSPVFFFASSSASLLFFPEAIHIQPATNERRQQNISININTGVKTVKYNMALGFTKDRVRIKNYVSRPFLKRTTISWTEFLHPVFFKILNRCVSIVFREHPLFSDISLLFIPSRMSLTISNSTSERVTLISLSSVVDENTILSMR